MTWLSKMSGKNSRLILSDKEKTKIWAVNIDALLPLQGRELCM